MFRAVKPLNLTFLAVQALLNEPPDLLRGKAVLKGEKRVLLWKARFSPVYSLGPSFWGGHEDRRKVELLCYWLSRGHSSCCKCGLWHDVGKLRALPQNSSRVLCPSWRKPLHVCRVELWVMAEQSPAAAFSLRSSVAASSSISTVITPFIYARLCWESFPLSLDVCYKPKAHV